MRSVSSPMAVSMRIGMFELGAQLAADFEAALAGQHQVEDDEIDARRFQHVVHRGRIARREDPVTVLRQKARDQIANLAIVVDDEKACFAQRIDSWHAPRWAVYSSPGPDNVTECYGNPATETQGLQAGV